MKILPDLVSIVQESQYDLLQLKEGSLFISGGTGFFGKWLLDTLLFAEQELRLNMKICVLSRDPHAFLAQYPHYQNSLFHFIKGDVADFQFPEGQFSHIVHAATEASAKLNSEHPEEMLRVTTQGTRHMLAFAQHCKATHFLLTSSGAVYGQQPSTVTHMPEVAWENCIDPLKCLMPESAYAQGKRLSEVLCALASEETGLQCKIARCYAFLGPHLPLDAHFAAGNFLRDALAGQTLQIAGDGTPYRSYLHPAELMRWLLAILVRGENNRPYNVGSDEAVSIAELAQAIAKQTGVNVHITQTAKPGTIPARYVPSTERAKKELQLTNTFSLDETIRRTIEWHQQQRKKLR